MDTPINNSVPYPINTNDPVLRNGIPDATFSKLKFPHRRAFNIGIALAPEQAAFPIEHQWRVLQSDVIEEKNQLTVRKGNVEWGGNVVAEELTFDAPTEEETIYCEITLDGSGNATGAVIDHKKIDEVPEDSPTKIHHVIAEIYNRYPEQDFFPAIRQIQFDPIRRVGEGYHPFKILTSIVLDKPKYRLAKGSIQDGTNGAAIDLTGVIETDFDATAGYVVIEATVATDLSLSDWKAVIVSNVTDTAEVKMTTSDPLRQEKIRLLIGKITLADIEATVWQAWYTSARVSHGFLNGSLVRVLESAPTEASKI